MQVPAVERSLSGGDLVQRILDEVASCVAAQTTFRRVLVSVYDRGIIPGFEDSVAAITRATSRGLTAVQEERIARFIARGGTVSGARYRSGARLSRSYFFPRGEGLPPTSVRIPSLRRFLGNGGWSDDDVLLTPFWVDGEIIGQISVDDPIDGARPSDEHLHRLEELADLVAVALRDARNLEQLSENHQVFQFLAESAMTGVLVVRGEAARYVNRRACDLLGYDKEQLLAQSPWWQVIHPDDRPQAWVQPDTPPNANGTLRAIRRDGRVIWLTTSVYPMEHPTGGAFVLHFYDITDHVETESQLREKALRDPLTGLLNRSFFEDAIRTEIERSRRYKRPLTVMMADLARFKQVNDRLGHQEGDRILKGIACVMQHQLRDSDWVVRYGGDEFLFVLPETGPEIATLDDRLRRAVAAWSAENVEGVDVSVDFGWSTWTVDHPRDADTLVREADRMLYRTKEEHSSPRQGET